jgi:hypothetical protein
MNIVFELYWDECKWREEVEQKIKPKYKRRIVNVLLFLVFLLGTPTCLMVFKQKIFLSIDIIFPNLPNWETGIVGAVSIAITIASFVFASLRSFLKESYQNKLYNDLKYDDSRAKIFLYKGLLAAHPAEDLQQTVEKVID